MSCAIKEEGEEEEDEVSHSPPHYYYYPLLLVIVLSGFIPTKERLVVGSSSGHWLTCNPFQVAGETEFYQVR